ncbi:MAG: hypothetical protein F4X97_06730 [Boseongicola sp. SB0662_bin_57]|nr:hypothetical protein [Boseongicola sp. SB0662_bin_57]
MAASWATSETDAWLLRAGQESVRHFTLGEDATSLTPSFEVEIRRNEGNAKTGLGADLGGGIAFADPGVVCTLT